MQPHKYSITLSGKERQVLRQLKRAGKSERRLADRARIILWTAERTSVAVIAGRLEVHRSTVINWRRWFLQRREQGLAIVDRLRDRHRSGRPSQFTAREVAQIKAIACEQPAKQGRPLSRFSLAELGLAIKEAQVVPTISTSTLWRLLHGDAIRPWYYRSWLFPRDPHFLAKAEPVLDLYQRLWQGQPLSASDYVICADEKSAIQVLTPLHPTVAPLPERPGRYEFEYQRQGTLAYLVALDVFSGRVFGRIDDSTGIVPFAKLVNLVMSQEPYASAGRVFWIMDGGPSHHPNTSPARLQAAYPNLIAVHLPSHASWLNQVEIYLSIVQRKALTPMDLSDRAAAAARILGFQDHYNETAKPFHWTFTRHHLQARLQAIAA
ncbi:MAG: IS630 family transposase [Anaerolineae bacterium]